jgi:hypothetical protein
MQRGDGKKSARKAMHGVRDICVHTIHSVALLLVVLPFSHFPYPPLVFVLSSTLLLLLIR